MAKIFRQAGSNLNPSAGLTYGDLVVRKDGSLGAVNQSNAVVDTATVTAVAAAQTAANIAAPTGCVQQFAGSSAPSGWLLCQGSAVSRTTYAALYAVIGTTYGAGNGSTTFNLPDMRGKVPVGYNSSETEFNTLGKTGGAKTHTLTTTQIPNVNGNITMHSSGNGTNITSANGVFQASPFTQGKYRDGGNLVNSSVSIDTINMNFGGGQAHNNLQPYITLNYIIKT